ncbi:hypothetical protein DDI_4490 [Dickeya dianthicola RNS04.9]|nr:hypothetical protein DDI_4490 [Dickeya dianthicola RNS04.9]
MLVEHRAPHLLTAIIAFRRITGILRGFSCYFLPTASHFRRDLGGISDPTAYFRWMA